MLLKRLVLPTWQVDDYGQEYLGVYLHLVDTTEILKQSSSLCLERQK